MVFTTTRIIKVIVMWQKIKENWWVDVFLASLIGSQLILLFIYLFIGILVVMVTFELEYFQSWTSEGWMWYRGISLVVWFITFMCVENCRD